jgi:hypothetical protein
MEVEIKINGLPVTVDVTMAPAEPDVGIMGAYVDDYRIVAIGSRRVRAKENTGWLDRKVTDEHMREMAEKAEQAMQDDYDDYRIESYRSRYDEL